MLPLYKPACEQKWLYFKYTFIFRLHNHKWCLGQFLERQKRCNKGKKKKRHKLTTNLRGVLQPSNHVELQLQTQRWDVNNYSSLLILSVQSRSTKVIYIHTTRAQQPANMCSSRAKQGYGSVIMSELKEINWVANNPSETITSTNKVGVCVCVSISMW